MATCKGTLDIVQKIVQSPNYPSNYPDGALCTWSIRTKLGNQIFLTVEKFNTETGDYLKIFDGRDSTAKTIGMIDGNPGHRSITLIGNELFLQFTSDVSGNKKGFLLRYTVKGAKHLK